MALGNRVVRRCWEQAKQASNRGEKEAPNGQTWKWFSLAIALTYSQKIADMYEESTWGNLKELDAKNNLAMELYNQYLLRWMNDSSGMTEKEWDGLVAKQETIARIGHDYYAGNQNFLYVDRPLTSPIVLTDQRKEALLDEGIRAYKDGNKAKVLEIMGRLRDPQAANRAGPVGSPANALLAAR